MTFRREGGIGGAGLQEPKASGGLTTAGTSPSDSAHALSRRGLLYGLAAVGLVGPVVRLPMGLPPAQTAPRLAYIKAERTLRWIGPAPSLPVGGGAS